MSNIHHQQTSKRNRPTKALLEHNLNEVYRLMIAGMTSRDIMQQLKLNDRTFRRYVKKIRDRNVTDQLAKRQEYFLDDVKLAKDRLLMAKRYNLAIVNKKQNSTGTNNMCTSKERYFIGSCSQAYSHQEKF